MKPTLRILRLSVLAILPFIGGCGIKDEYGVSSGWMCASHYAGAPQGEPGSILGGPNGNPN